MVSSTAMSSTNGNSLAVNVAREKRLFADLISTLSAVQENLMSLPSGKDLQISSNLRPGMVIGSPSGVMSMVAETSSSKSVAVITN